MKKLLLSIGTVLVVATPVAATLSCTSNSPDKTPPITPPKTPDKTNPGAGLVDWSTIDETNVIKTGTPTDTTQTGTPTDITQTGTPTDQSDDFMTIGPKVATLDWNEAGFQKNVVLNKDGNILQFKKFEPIKGTRANSRHHDVTDPHPTTVLAEKFTRTSSPGAMDVTGYTPDGTIDENKLTEAELDPLIAAADDKQAFASVTPISTIDFQNLGILLDKHLLVLDYYNIPKTLDITYDNAEEVVDGMMSKLGINLKALGIMAVKGTITRKVFHGDNVLEGGPAIRIMELSNVVFKLKDEPKYIIVDFSVLMK